MLSHALRAAAGNAGGPVVPAITYIAATDDQTDLTTYTFSSQDIGDPSADRLVIVGVSGIGSGFASRTLSSGSIAGVSATVHITASAAFAGGIMSANVTSGSSGTISVTFSGSMASCTIAVWVATGLTSFSPEDTATDSGASASATITTSDGGVGVGIIRTVSGASWTNLTEDFDNLGGPTYIVSGASGTFTGSSTTISAGNPSPSRMFVGSWS